MSEHKVSVEHFPWEMATQREQPMELQSETNDGNLIHTACFVMET